MALSLQEMLEIQESAGFAKFVNTNLHLHTPATPWDWDSWQNQTRQASTITPEEYFDTLNKTDLELVAITDHNCVSWCKPLVQLAKEGRRKSTSRIHILPGVEVTTYEGPHLIAIFEENQDVEEIRKMLVRLGMSGEGKQGDRVGCESSDSKTIDQVLTEINDLGGLAIAPHVQSKDGLWGPKEFKGRYSILNSPRLRILAAPSGEIKRVIDANGNMVGDGPIYFRPTNPLKHTSEKTPCPHLPKALALKNLGG